MRTVNALEIRNRFGAVLAELEKTGEPVIVSKGRKPRAVLISVEDFQRRFIDRQTEDRRKELMERVLAARAGRAGGADTVSVLRELRGPLGEVRH